MDPSQMAGLPDEDQQRMVAMIESMQTRDRCESNVTVICSLFSLVSLSSLSSLWMRHTVKFSSPPPLSFHVLGFAVCACTTAWWRSASLRACRASGGRRWRKTRRGYVPILLSPAFESHTQTTLTLCFFGKNLFSHRLHPSDSIGHNFMFSCHPPSPPTAAVCHQVLREVLEALVPREHAVWGAEPANHGADGGASRSPFVKKDETAFWTLICRNGGAADAGAVGVHGAGDGHRVATLERH